MRAAPLAATSAIGTDADAAGQCGKQVVGWVMKARGW